MTCVDLDLYNQNGIEESVCMRCPDGYTGDGRICRGMAHIIFYFIHLVHSCTRKPNTKTKWTKPLFEDFHLFRKLFIRMKFPFFPSVSVRDWKSNFCGLTLIFFFFAYVCRNSKRWRFDPSRNGDRIPIMIQFLFHAWFTIDVQAPAISVPPGLFYFRR